MRLPSFSRKFDCDSGESPWGCSAMSIPIDA
jgi:hypothetical protein